MSQIRLGDLLRCHSDDQMSTNTVTVGAVGAQKVKFIPSLETTRRVENSKEPERFGYNRGRWMSAGKEGRKKRGFGEVSGRAGDATELQVSNCCLYQ